MKVMLADIDDAALSNAEEGLLGTGMDVGTVHCDVTNIESMRSAATATIKRFEKVHLLANNAGVFLEGGAGDIPLEKWRWVIDVNFTSVVYGVETFLPLIRSHGEGGHILNTASVAGFVGFAGIAPYNATKHAVVGYKELNVSRIYSDFTKWLRRFRRLANSGGAHLVPKRCPDLRITSRVLGCRDDSVTSQVVSTA